MYFPEWIDYFLNLQDELQKGGGTTTKVSPNVKKIKQEFIKLGWKPSYIRKNLDGLQDDMIEEYVPRHVIEGLSSSWLKKYNTSNTSVTSITSKDISTILMELGIQKQIAIHTENVLQPLLNTCYTDIQLLYIAFEYIRGVYRPIRANNIKYYTNPNVIMQWFSHEYSPKKYIDIMNIPYTCSIDIYEIVLKNIQNTPHINSSKSSFFYHTTSWASSESIFNNIYHNKGKYCLDFGLQPGFYLAYNLEDSLEWGNKKNKLFSNEVAILVFSIPHKMPSKLRIKELKGPEWEYVTQQSRLCDRKIDEIPQIEEYDILYGNMVNNPKDIIRYGNRPTTHKPSKKQLVSKTTNSDRYLRSKLVGCYYFMKSI
jgi:hypothetical protein